MGGEHSQLQQDHQIQMARAKMRHACANIDTKWETASAQIQLILQCCANCIIIDIPHGVCILGVKIEAMSAFATAITQADTLMLPYNQRKHLLLLSTDSSVHSATAVNL